MHKYYNSNHEILYVRHNLAEVRSVWHVYYHAHSPSKATLLSYSQFDVRAGAQVHTQLEVTVRLDRTRCEFSACLSMHIDVQVHLSYVAIRRMDSVQARVHT